MKKMFLVLVISLALMSVTPVLAEDIYLGQGGSTTVTPSGPSGSNVFVNPAQQESGKPKADIYLGQGGSTTVTLSGPSASNVFVNPAQEESGKPRVNIYLGQGGTTIVTDVPVNVFTGQPEPRK